MNNDLLDFNMYEQSLSFMGQKRTGTYSTEQIPAPKVDSLTVTENGDYSAADQGLDGYSTVSVNVSGGTNSGSDVVFYDYDGSVLYSYSAEDFLALTEMPANYTYHEGFTAQGWNWSMANAKSYVSTFGKLSIGQMCITSDGKTRFYLDVYDEEETNTFYLYALADDISTGATIRVDWGDGSEPVEYSSSAYGLFGADCNYTNVGKYTVTLEVISGKIKLGGDSSDDLCTCIEVGENVTEVSALSFRRLHNVNVPMGVNIGTTYAFQETQLSCLVLSDSVTTIYANAFDSCHLNNLILSDSVTTIQSDAFRGGNSYLTLYIPNGVTTLEEDVFSGVTLQRIYIPNSVTNIYPGAIDNRPLDIIIDNVKGAILNGEGDVWDPDSEYSAI